MPLVVDTSALVFACVETTKPATRLLARLREDICHAPHLLDAEFGNVLRRLAVQGELDPDLALAFLYHGSELIDLRHEHHGELAAEAWSFRDNLTFYDALFVVLAATLDATLLTLDRRIARLRGLPCRVEVPTAK